MLQAGTSPKSNATDYPAHAKLDNLSIGAEYLAHSFSGHNHTFVAADYLVVEVGLFPSQNKSLDVENGHFTLRVNGKKQVLFPQAPAFVAASLKYPDWVCT